jgi:hypothetical protein
MHAAAQVQDTRPDTLPFLPRQEPSSAAERSVAALERIAGSLERLAEALAPRTPGPLHSCFRFGFTGCCGFPSVSLRCRPMAR